MTYFFYITVCVSLIILQTAIVPYLPAFGGIFDLALPFVIYLGLYRPAREGLPMALLIGFIMDSLSGSPFGLYMTTYCWLLIGTKWITGYLQVGNRVLLLLIVPGGVLVENFIFIAIFAALAAPAKLPAATLKTVVVQELWALATGALWLMAFRGGQRRLVGWAQHLFADHDRAETEMDTR